MPTNIPPAIQPGELLTSCFVLTIARNLDKTPDILKAIAPKILNLFYIVKTEKEAILRCATSHLHSNGEVCSGHAYEMDRVPISQEENLFKRVKQFTIEMAQEIQEKTNDILMIDSNKPGIIIRLEETPNNQHAAATIESALTKNPSNIDFSPELNIMLTLLGLKSNINSKECLHKGFSPIKESTNLQEHHSHASSQDSKEIKAPDDTYTAIEKLQHQKNALMSKIIADKDLDGYKRLRPQLSKAERTLMETKLNITA